VTDQEPVAWREVVGKTTKYYDYNEQGRGEPLYLHREWVGLATEEARKFYESDLSREELIHKIDEFLQEKNT
jgi:hypothetical protein